MVDDSEAERNRSRRAFLGVVGTSVSLGLAGCSSGSDTTPADAGTDTTTDTPTATETSTPTATETSTSTATPTADLGEELWRLDPKKDFFYGPAVGNGLLFILMGGSVHAFDGVTGEAVATASVGFETGAPLVDGDTLYAPAGGKLTALTATASLEQQWRAEAFDPADSDDPEARQYMLREPVVVDDSVYVMEQRQGDQSDDSRFALYRLNRNTGKRRWLQRVPHGAVAATATAGTVYIAGRRGGAMSGLEPADGSERWRYDPDEPIRHPPVVDDGTAYVGVGSFGGGGRIQALDPATGSELWAINHGRPGWPVRLDAERFYVGGMGVQAFDRNNRSRVWTAKTSGQTFLTVGASRVYAAAENGVYAYDAATGEEQWAGSTEAAASGRPIYADGVVYVQDEDGLLYAFAAD